MMAWWPAGLHPAVPVRTVRRYAIRASREAEHRLWAAFSAGEALSVIEELEADGFHIDGICDDDGAPVPEVAPPPPRRDAPGRGGRAW